MAPPPPLTRDALIIGSARECNIDIEPHPCTRPYLVRASCPRKEGPVVIAMNRNTENIGIVVEYLLRPIPMMDVLRIRMGIMENSLIWYCLYV